MKYLLPCDQCGTEHEVDPSQAGENLQCQCGRTLEVPSLRGLRELRPVTVQPAKPAASRTSRELPPRLILVGGMLLMAIGLIVAAYGGLIRSQIRIPEPPPIEDIQADATIDGLSPADTHRLWTEFRDQGLGPYQVSFPYIAELTQRYYTNLLLGGLIVTGIGILLVVGALCMPSNLARSADRVKQR